MSSRKERLEEAKKDSFLLGLAVGARSPSQVPKAIEGLRALGIEFSNEAEKIAKVVAQLKKSDQGKFKAIFGKTLERKESKVDKIDEKVSELKEKAQRKLNKKVSKIEEREKRDRELLEKAKETLGILQSIVNSDSMSKLLKDTEKEVVIANCNIGESSGRICLGFKDSFEYNGDFSSGEPTVYHHIIRYPVPNNTYGTYIAPEFDLEITEKKLGEALKDTIDTEVNRARVKVLARLTEEEIWKQVNKQI